VAANSTSGRRSRNFPKPISGNPFTGILDKRPLEDLSESLFNSAVERNPSIHGSYEDAKALHHLFQIRERVNALAKHYELQDFDSRDEAGKNDLFVELFYCLAVDFLVSFNWAEAVGPLKPGPEKQFRDHKRLFELENELSKYAAKGIKERSAILNLTKRQGSAWTGENPEAVRKKLQRFRTDISAIDAARNAHPMLKALLRIKDGGLG
jgi:hypothetical protein